MNFTSFIKKKGGGVGLTAMLIGVDQGPLLFSFLESGVMNRCPPLSSRQIFFLGGERGPKK